MNQVNHCSEIIGPDGEIVEAFRNRAYRIFTLASGKVMEGGCVERLKLKGAGIEIPALLVGEQGRGRKQGVLSVQLDKQNYSKWQANEPVRLGAAALGKTKSGKVKLLGRSEVDDENHAIGIFRTPIGFRGSNNHTGDRTGEVDKDFLGNQILKFAPFPGIVLEKGVIAQGDAGRMGYGEQLIALVPRDQVFRTGYGGRLYGSPSAHYYRFDGQGILSATWDERSASDLF